MVLSIFFSRFSSLTLLQQFYRQVGFSEEEQTLRRDIIKFNKINCVSMNGNYMKIKFVSRKVGLFNYFISLSLI